jgi:hypothetical protein
MGRKQRSGRRKGSKKTILSEIRKCERKMDAIPNFIKQHGLKQEVVTLHDVLVEVPSVEIGTTNIKNCKPAFLHANGFQSWSAGGTLTAPAVPQRAIFDAYASIYKYYAVEHITLKYVPTRL